MQTISILQGDIDNLETEKGSLLKQLETPRKSSLTDMKHPSRIRTLGGPGSPYVGGPSSTPFVGHVQGGVASSIAKEDLGSDGKGDDEGVAGSHPLLLSRVCLIVSALYGYYLLSMHVWNILYV